MINNHLLCVKPSPIHGLGVFASTAISADALIEECPVLLSTIALPMFADYLFSAGEKQEAIALGYGSLYNHANEPNATYGYDSDRRLIIFTARRAITAGEEITIPYGNDWFSSRQMQMIANVSWWRKLIAALLLRVINIRLPQ